MTARTTRSPAYLHGDGFDQTFARVTCEPTTPVVGSILQVHWLLTDHLNSVRLVLDESGAVLDQIAYDAFGNVVAQLNPLLVNPILFASREFDFETGLYHNRARYLDPSTGHWTTQDPLGFAAGDANLYRYVFNAPTVYTDPSGQVIFIPLAIIAVATALAGGYTVYESYQSTGNPFDGQIWGAFGEGVVYVGPRVIVNGVTDTVVSAATLGFVDRSELWPVPPEYRDAYRWGYAGSRPVWELELALLIHRIPGRAGHFVYEVDHLQNFVLVGRGVFDMPQITRHGGGPLRLDWSEGMLLHGVSLENTTDVASGLFGLYGLGREYEFGRNFRLAPFGNRSGHPIGRWPHYHRRVPDPDRPGQSLPGQGIGRHRPWETSTHDTSWWDRW